MPPRSKIYDLPQELRDELNERLVTNGFQGYEALTKWLEENGFKLSRSAVHRYGSALQEEFDEAMGAVRKSTEMARAWAESDEDTQGALMGATSQMVQQQLMQITLALGRAEHEPEKAAKHMATVSHALADLGRMTINQKKWAQEVRKEVMREAADKAAEVAKRGGLSADVVNDLRRELLGIA